MAGNKVCLCLLYLSDVFDYLIIERDFYIKQVLSNIEAMD